VVTSQVPDIVPWLPLIAMTVDVEIPPTPEIEMLADVNPRTRLHKSVIASLEVVIRGPALIEIKNAHHIDEASAELLSYLTENVQSRGWLFAVARRRGGGFEA